MASPVARLEIDPSLSHAAEVKARGAKADAAAERRRGSASDLRSRVQAERHPATLEAYARYLMLTQCDDDAEHLARDLATRAAQKAPTIARAAPRREPGREPQPARRVDRPGRGARRRAAAPPRTIASRHAAGPRGARARRRQLPRRRPLLRRASSPSIRDDVTANLARVELYGEANLRATALASLEQALLRRPRSVALIRAMVGALRQEDRTTEADEMEERYAALRFDDVSYMQGKVDLYIARRDAAQATRWIERMLDVDPDDADKLTSAARGYISLGDRTRAIAMYKRALDLAPEDTEAMRALADVYAIGGQDGEKVTLLCARCSSSSRSRRTCATTSRTSSPRKPKEDEVYAVRVEGLPRLAGRAPPPARIGARSSIVTVATVFANGLSSKFHQIVYQPLTERAAQDGRNYGFAFESDTQSRAAPRRPRVPRRTARSTTPSTPRSAAPTIRRWPCTPPPRRTACASRASRRATSSSCSTASRTWPQRNAFADYFGDVAYLQSDEPDRPRRVRADHAEDAHLLLQRAQGPEPDQERRGEGRQAHLPLRRHERPAHRERAAAWRRTPRSSATCTSPPTRAGTTWAPGTGAS